MANFFDKYELYTEGDSVYCYKGTCVLKNKFGIKNIDLLRQAETELVFAAMLELELEPIKGNFDKEHLYDIHRFLFSNIYDFAGKTRTEDISKGSTKFCVYHYITENMDKLFATVKEKEKGIKRREDVIDFFSFLMAELNIIHPFREGNGRAIREYIREYASALGYNIDWSKVDKEYLLDSMIKSVFDLAELKECLNKVTFNKNR